MATVKFYLRKKVLKDGTSPLVFKVIKDGRPSISHTGISINHADWDANKRRVRKTHANHTQLNNYLLKQLSEANNKAIEAQTLNNTVSSKTIIKKIKPNSGLSFFKYGQNYAADLFKAGKYTERNSALASMEHFRSFLGGSDVSFPDITISLLERYKLHLTSEVKTTDDRNLSPVTVRNNLAFIRRIFNQAIEAKDVEQKYYPFGKTGMELKTPETTKLGLAANDVTMIEDVELKNPKHNHARNLWLISFYFGGMRASDVLLLKWSDFRENRLIYTMGKNGKVGSLKINEKVSFILCQYELDKRFTDDHIFPELKEFANLNDKFELKKFISNTVSAISGILRVHVAPLAGVTGKLSMHIARHTFGNLAGEMNISLLLLQKIFRHSSILTTMNYMKNFIHKETDEAMDMVLDFVPKLETKMKIA